MSRSRAARVLLAAALAAAGCVGTPPPEPQRQGPVQRRVPPPLPAASEWGTHILALEVDRAGGMWAGTAGDGIWYLPPDSSRWRHIEPASDDDSSISWGHVNALASADDGTVWYGTVGNGFGMSADTGRTWQNWTIDQLGPEWQYVALNGIRIAGDTVLIGTADGVRITGDGGATWRCVQSAASAGGAPADDGCASRVAGLPSEYVLSLDVGEEGEIWVGHLAGLSLSEDGGRTWRNLGTDEGVPPQRIRAVAATVDTMVWVATESEVLVDSLSERNFVPATIRLPGWDGLPGRPRAIVPAPGVPEPSIVLSHGLAAGNGLGNFRIYFLAAGDDYKPAADMWSMTWTGPPLWPVGGSQFGLSRVLAGEGPTVDYSNVRLGPDPTDARHTRFGRPIVDAAGTNPYIDPTYRYGSTMGGNFQQHMGIEFNNPAGTPVLAVANGIVAFAGEAEAGSNTVAILHDHRQDGFYVYSVYYHNRSLAVQAGQRVLQGEVIAEVGNTGRATNDHLHLEIHVAPRPDSAAIVNPDDRFPLYTVNPELWIEPLPGTGTVAGRVVDENGGPVAGARIYGLVLPYPAETPFSFVETYGTRAHADPSYNENFAIGDVPAGTYLLGTDIGNRRVWRRIRVEPGRVTFVEFRP